MPQKPSLASRWIFWGVIALSVLATLPLFLAAFSAFPAADDFTFALRTHAEWQRSHSLSHVLMDALRGALRAFRDWQGTFTGILMMSLGPAAFSWRIYPLHAVLLLLFSLACLLALLWALSRVLYGREDTRFVPAAFALWALSWILLPDLREGLYWYNSAWFYTATQYLAYLAFALLLWLRSGKGMTRMRTLGWIALYLLMLWIGLNNYVTAVMTLCIMALAALQGFRRREADRFRILGAALALGLCLLISVLAPGNQVRMARDATGGLVGLNLTQTLLTALGQSFVLMGRYLFTTPLWAVAAIALALGATQEHPPHWRGRTLAALPLAAWGILVVMLCPHLYASGTIGSPRVANLYQLWILLSSLGCAYVLGGGLRRLLVSMNVPRRALRIAAGLLSGLLLFLVAFLQPTQYRLLIRDALDGALGEYRQEMTQRFIALEQAPADSDLVLSPVEGAPGALDFGLVSPDPGEWVNQDTAAYFGLGKVWMEGEDNSGR